MPVDYVRAVRAEVARATPPVLAHIDVAALEKAASGELTVLDALHAPLAAAFRSVGDALLTALHGGGVSGR